MKTETWLLIGAAAVAGYLYARRKATAPATAVAQPQAIAMQQPAVPPDAYDAGYVMPGWTWGGPVWGAGSWGGFRGNGHGHHGGHGGHGGHH